MMDTVADIGLVVFTVVATCFTVMFVVTIVADQRDARKKKERDLATEIAQLEREVAGESGGQVHMKETSRSLVRGQLVVRYSVKVRDGDKTYYPNDERSPSRFYRDQLWASLGVWCRTVAEREKIRGDVAKAYATWKYSELPEK